MDLVLFKIEIAVESLSAIMAFVIWYYAYRAYRFLSSVSLLFLSASFLLLAIGLISQAAYTYLAMPLIARYRSIFFGEGYLLYSVLSLAAFLILAFAYSINERPATLAPAFSPFKNFITLRASFSYVIQVASTILLVFVVAKIFSEYMTKKSSYSFYVGMGFTFMVVQQFVRLVDIDSDVFYIISSIIQLVGFAFILFAVWRVSSK